MTAQLDNFQKYLLIAHQEVPVTRDSPLYDIFAQRKEISKKLNEKHPDREVLIQMITHCNTIIKTYLGL